MGPRGTRVEEEVCKARRCEEGKDSDRMNRMDRIRGGVVKQFIL